MLTAIGAADPRTGAFAVGVMRRDGALLPIAAFDGKQWRVTWPGPALDLEVPITLTSVPKAWWGPTKALADWQVWTGANEPRDVHVTQPDWVQAHCLRQIALRTDYKSSEPAPRQDDQPYPKDGLALSTPMAVQRIERLSSATVDAIGLPDAVRDAFNEAERDTVSRFNHQVGRAERESGKVTIEAVYTHGDALRVYYVEASRTYKKDGGRDNECRMSFGTGWFTSDDAGTFARIDMAVDLLPCNRYGASYMLPLGVIRAAGRLFWVVQYSGWDHERYLIAEIKAGKVEAAVVKAGGGC